MVRADQFSWNFGPPDQNFRRTKISVTAVTFDPQERIAEKVYENIKKCALLDIIIDIRAAGLEKEQLTPVSPVQS